MSKTVDERWKRFNSHDFKCPCCERTFGGIFDIGFDHPFSWPHENRQKSGVETLEVGDDSLSSDLCSIGEERFVRCTLPIKVVGTDQVFRFGPWASLKSENFNRYVEAWEANDYSNIDAFFGWLCNTLPGVGMSDDALPCDVVNFSSGSRPEIWVHEDAHPLADMQRNGITFDQLLDIYEASGNDVRPHLGKT